VVREARSSSTQHAAPIGSSPFELRWRTRRVIRRRRCRGMGVHVCAIATCGAMQRVVVVCVAMGKSAALATRRAW